MIRNSTTCFFPGAGYKEGTMKKIFLALALCAFAAVPALQAGESAKPCDQAKATCTEAAKATCDTAKAACCSSEKKVVKVLHSPRGALLARR